MDHYYDHHAVKVLIATAIEDGPRGTQAKLARHVGVPQPTVSRWQLMTNCPSHTTWPAIEEFFEWEPGTIKGVGGVGKTALGETETAILGDPRLTENQREVMLRILTQYIEDNALRDALRGDRRPTQPTARR